MMQDGNKQISYKAVAKKENGSVRVLPLVMDLCSI